MPQIALISDIHSNIDALEAVLEDIKGQEVDEIVCLGDIVGYGAAPAECLRLVRERCSVTVMGNHDQYAQYDIPIIGLSSHVAEGVKNSRKELTEEDRQWIKGLPLACEIHGFTIVHASLSDPNHFNYLLNDQEALFHFHEQKNPVCFFGHTHRPEVILLQGEQIRWGLIWEGDTLLDRSKKCAINVGSVGQPRDGNPKAAYGIYDSGIGLFTLRRIAYDVDMAIQRIREAGLPEENGLRLLKGE